MKRAGRPSNSLKKLKDGYYIFITVQNTKKPVRIMRETLKQVEEAKKQYNNHNFKYIGQVKDNFWIDGENKGKSTA